MSRRTSAGFVAAALCATLGCIAVACAALVGPGRRPAAPRANPRPARAADVVRTLVALGDSVPSGAACGCPGFVRLVADGLAARQHAAVTMTNLAVDGLTTAGLLRQLQDPSTERSLRDADVTLVTIGANDFDADKGQILPCHPSDPMACYASDIARAQARLTAVLQEVHTLVPAGRRVVVTGYWNVFLDGDVAAARGPSYTSVSDAVTRAVNAAIAQACAETGSVYVDLYTPFRADGSLDDTRLLAADGDHPSAAGHRLIAATVLAAL